MTNIPTLTTNRLSLRAFTEQDVDALHRVLSDPEVHRYFPRTDPSTQAQVEKIIASQLEHWKEHKCGWWAVVLRSSGELIGWCGLQFLPEFGETEVAFLLSKAHWGKGLGTEAARAAARFGFETLGLESLAAIAHVENTASQRVIAKLGMSLIEQLHLWGIECYRYRVQREIFAPTAQTCFLTMFKSAQGAQRARLVIESLRSFGGQLSDCPVWVFLSSPESAAHAFHDIDNVHFIPLIAEEEFRHYLFAEKVYACAQAAELAGTNVRSLVWLDSSCLIVNPPTLFDLAPSFDAAFRPVHIKNIGSPAQEVLDDFWQAVYKTVGVKDIPFTVESFVDSQTLRPYYNTHCFAVNPSTGLFHAWLDHFKTMISDQAFQSGPCGDELHQIFLHQAILSALLVKQLDSDQICTLPPAYSYPLHLHQQVPPARQPHSLNDLACPVYEEVYRYPDTLNGLPVHEPLKSWLMERMPGA